VKSGCFGDRREVLRTERQFDLAAASTSQHERLPEESQEDEPVPLYDAVWDFTGVEVDTFGNF